MRRLLLAALAAAPSLAFAAATPGFEVPLDHAVRVPVRGAAVEEVVGSPKYLDVTVIDTSTVLVHGKELGVTNLVIYDAGGRPVFNQQVAVVAPSGDQVSVFKGPKDSTEYVCVSRCRQAPTAPRNPFIEMMEAAASMAASSDRR